MFSSVTDKNNPFRQISLRYRTERIARFEPDSVLGAEYCNRITGDHMDKIIIGWMCERDSFFAYLYKKMKKEAKERQGTRLAREIAHAGFGDIVAEIEQWIVSQPQPVLMVPIASRHGVSEAFADELYAMLGSDSRERTKMKPLFEKVNKTIEIKKIKNWLERYRSTEGLFALHAEVPFDQYVVLLVDDIVTSGASLHRSAKMLKERGAKHIAAVALATNLFDSNEVTKETRPAV
jgi:predicted amidophosphoribosyltransferase